MCGPSRRTARRQPDRTGVYPTTAYWRVTVTESERKAETPDGLVYYFNTDGYLTQVQDAFANTLLTLTYRANGWQIATVVQTIGSDTREVVLGYDDDRVSSLTYAGRVWQFLYGPIDTNTEYVGEDLVEVIPPAGPALAFRLQDPRHRPGPGLGVRQHGHGDDADGWVGPIHLVERPSTAVGQSSRRHHAPHPRSGDGRSRHRVSARHLDLRLCGRRRAIPEPKSGDSFDRHRPAMVPAIAPSTTTSTCSWRTLSSALRTHP